MKLTITLIFGQYTKLLVHPLRWFVAPTWKTKYTKACRKESIVIRVPAKDDFDFKNVNRKYEDGFILSWLCLTFHGTYMKATEVATIYPANYNEEYDDQWLEKWEQLCATDFYN